MANLKPALKATLGQEGIYSKDPSDTGGETYMGISRNNFPKWAGWPIIDAAKLRSGFPKCLTSNLTLNSMVEQFYNKEFWTKIHGCQLINEKVAADIFDTAVNMGCIPAIKMAQQSVGLAETGIMDMITIETLNKVV